MQWKGQVMDEATWEDAEDFQKNFSQFILKAKDNSQEGAIVAKREGPSDRAHGDRII